MFDLICCCVFCFYNFVFCLVGENIVSFWFDRYCQFDCQNIILDTRSSSYTLMPFVIAWISFTEVSQKFIAWGSKGDMIMSWFVWYLLLLSIIMIGLRNICTELNWLVLVCDKWEKVSVGKIERGSFFHGDHLLCMMSFLFFNVFFPCTSVYVPTIWNVGTTTIHSLMLTDHLAIAMYEHVVGMELGLRWEAVDA